MRRVFGVLLFLCLPIGSFAQKEKSYPLPPDKVFEAAVATVKANKDYTPVAVSREDLVLSFRTSGGMRAMTGYDITVTFAPEPAGCESEKPCSGTLVKLDVGKRDAKFTWGGGGAARKEFFKRLDDELAKKKAS